VSRIRTANASKLVRAFAQGFSIGALTTAGVVAIYLIKSAMGINLMQARSPLHDLLFHFVS